MMKIVVLEGFTLNPGDLNWEDLYTLGDVTIYNRTPDDQIVTRASGAQAILSNKTRLTRSVLEQLPDLKYIGVLATGYDSIDVKAAREKGITVTHVPTYGTRSVAQMTFAHILNLVHRLADHNHSVQSGNWSKAPDYCYWEHPLTELDGQILGILGLGRIGKAVAEIGHHFGMNIIYHDTQPPSSVPPSWQAVSINTLFKSSDILTLHCPLTPETHEIVDIHHLKRMKKTAFLINTSRGGLIKSRDLAEALKGGVIQGAGLDVLDQEPPTADHPLIGIPNCFITPHIAWATRAARERLLKTAIENLKAYMHGKAIHVVTP
ncbi:MAG: hypothetical protein XD77_1186 [Marinimicrobia bacterium 46_47]|nr:MAG: hypothetical protein XD77_1186 [Marinimicrobia bacterium 46_47]KUK92340.1 MAG: hypothetical protein XE04_0602 [Marinimicrobia bacterium 46_43]